jgi:hypothetical protein
MVVNGCDCSIVIKTTNTETDIPYSDETLREAVSLFEEEPCIEGNGIKRAMPKISGVTGCVVTPLTIKTAPLLLYLAMGSLGKSVFISMTNNLYKYSLNLLPMEDTECFDLIQDRVIERRIYENCRIKGFELRIMREETIKLKLEISGNNKPKTYTLAENCDREAGERFNGDFVTFKINGNDYRNIYGLTLVCMKESGTRTELWIKRVLQKDNEIPSIIEELNINARLIRDKYESNYLGAFHITLKNLVLISDETEVNTSGAVISPIRFYVSGTVSCEVFTCGNEEIP